MQKRKLKKKSVKKKRYKINVKEKIEYKLDILFTNE